MTGRPIGLVSTRRGNFMEEASTEPCKWVMWTRDVQASRCSEKRGCKDLPMGAFVEGSCNCLGCNCFQAQFMPFILYSYLFLFKKLIRGHCPGVVTSGGNITHKYFHRMRILSRDETPFLLAMQPRVTTLAW